jgi:uncharacterized protein YdeI (YjbR/CyaY-like superfamily)
MEILYFENPTSFENHLKQHVDGDSFWLKISKKSEPKLTADAAVEVALCYGWIDSTNKRLDDDYYLKYFAKRRDKSVWSTKNKNTITRLIETNRMQPQGYAAIAVAKKNGCWDKGDAAPEDFDLDAFHTLISNTPNAFNHWVNMSKSIQKTYAMSYYTLKTEAARARRLLVILNRLEQNLKPM